MKKYSFKIGKHSIGSGRPFLIAEIAQSHDGNIINAHNYIDVIADTGFDAIKFQTHIADAESTLDEQFRVPIKGSDKTRYDYWKRMEFNESEWQTLSEHCNDCGFLFLSTPFSVAAVDLLEKLNVPAWKLGSGEFASFNLIQAMVSTGKPILLSSGMSRYDEIEKAINFIRDNGVDYGIFQCTSMYPTELRNIGLNVMDELGDRYQCPIGLSDHSSSIYPALAAMARGADLIEVHIILENSVNMPDAKSSLKADDLKLLSQARDAFYEILNNPVDKDQMAEKLVDMRKLFTKSVALKTDLKKGTVLTKEMLTGKKPGTGIPLTDIDRVIGRRLLHDKSADRLLDWKDFE